MFRRTKARWIAPLLAAVLVGLQMPAHAAASYIQSPPWADLGCSVWPGGIDTRPSCNAAASYLRAAGYSAFVDSPVSAAEMMGPYYAQSDAVWMINGHANALTITTHISSGDSYLTPYLTQYGSCNAPNDCISDYSATHLRRIKLMLFVGCDSAGDLQNRAYDRGVDLSVGFTATLDNNRSNKWVALFFDWTATYGADYATGASLATEQVIAQMGNAGGTDHRYVRGNTSIKLKPPSYGAY